MFKWVACLLWSCSAVAAPVCDGVTDDTAAIQAMVNAGGGVLPTGTCRVTSDIVKWTTAGVHHSPGFNLGGAGKLSTTILADYNGKASTGGVIRTDTTSTYVFIDDVNIHDLSISRAAGRTGLNGISLTAAWYVHIREVSVSGMSGDGIRVPWRPDIAPLISDPYQDFAVVVERSDFRSNTGWGINFGGGQSPGIYRLFQNTIYANLGGGIRSTTGQSEIIANIVLANGTAGTASGGIFFDTIEGPSMVAKVELNEIQDNYNWNMNLVRSRGIAVRNNRFLAGVYSGAVRPLVQVNLGAGASGEVWSCIFDQNYFRSVTGPGPTTAPVYAFDGSTGSMSAGHPCHFRYNDFGPMPPDGITQNSTGLSKFVNLTGAEIIDP
jgi:hypothetical protein